MQIKVTLIDRDGSEREKTLSQGTRLSSVVDLVEDAILLQGQPVATGRDPELRDGDEIEVVRKSHKAGV